MGLKRQLSDNRVYATSVLHLSMLWMPSRGKR